MQTTFGRLLAIALVLLALPARAFAANDDRQRCQEGWLDLSWARVAVRCDAAANNAEIDALHYERDLPFAGTPASYPIGEVSPDPDGTKPLLELESDLSFDWLNEAGRYFARAAYAYHRLHRDATAERELGAAIADVKRSLHFATTRAESAQSERVLAALVASAFFKTRPGQLPL